VEREGQLERVNVKALVVFLALLAAAPLGLGYSFLTHETIIDMAWNSSIVPVLKSRYPNLTDEQLIEAHAYAYGGSVIQDAGYYPFGHPAFSDLAHYVRTGDFITNLIHESRNVNELAFSLGALSHYVGDTIGHRYAVNIAVPQEFHDLEEVYGPVVTFEQGEHQHVRTEFAFDIDQLSHARFAPAAYYRRVGFRVPRRLLERAFYATYGLRLHTIVGDEVTSIRIYRWAVRQFLPRVAYAEVLLHRRDFPPDQQVPAFEEFEQRLKETDAAHHWEKYRKHKVSFETRLLAFVIFILPKIGPLSDLAIRGPNVNTEQDYVASVNLAMTTFDRLLGELAQKGKDGFAVPDLDLDTGFPTRPGAYRLTDKTYATLLSQVVKKTAMPPLGLRQNILAFYSNPNAPIATKRNKRKWKKVQDELAVLRIMPATRIPNAR
jgi:hypothetical protein